ncbi:MAG: energy transducer TonB [Proteobacteria bacterium]|nr:energy transducer TonB [Pseudomonadota bacterium]MBU1640560.1 energy transducer TonB [Pseudomonadota bacterium]
MNGTKQRLLFAGLLALALHCALLSWQLARPSVTLPTSLSCQRVTVSLGVREVASPLPAPKQIRQAVQVEKLLLSQTVSRIHKQEPVKKQKPERPQAIETEQGLVPPAAPELETPAEMRPAPASAALSPLAEIKKESTPTSAAAAQVIQQATPLYRLNPPPAYPRQARRRGLEGVVMLEAHIAISGRVTELRLFTSSGHTILDRAALKAVRRWRFIPGTVGHKRQEMWVKVPVRFQLQ